LGLIQIPQQCWCYVGLLQCAWVQGVAKALMHCLLRAGPSVQVLHSSVGHLWCVRSFPEINCISAW
jgi:hypothetical protein